MAKGIQNHLPRPNVVNIVATAELNQRVKLERLIHERGFQYDPTIYQCAYLKDKETQSKVMIFATGKMISAGTRSLDHAKKDLGYAARRLERLGLVERPRIVTKLQNIVATGDIGKPIDIEMLSIRLPNVLYEPEQFPGAIYYAEELGGASVLVFASGRVVFAGLKTRELLETAGHVLDDLSKLVL